MSSQTRIAFLMYLTLPPLLCANLHCFYSPYTTKDTQGVFKLVVTECPPKQLCYKASGHYGNLSALTHHGCMLLKDCSRVNMIKLKGAVYNTSYSCCDWSYCNAGTGISANCANILMTFLSLVVAAAPLSV